MADDLTVTDEVLEDPLVLRRLLSDIVERLDNDVLSVATAKVQADIAAAGGITSYYADEAPKINYLLVIGDLWFDTDDDNKPHRFSGVAWIEVRDGTIAQALSDATQAIADAASAQATADGKIITFLQATMPAGSIGDLWMDSDDGNRIYRHNGTTFIVIQDAEIAEALTDAATAITDAAGAQATADGKIVTFYQASMPTTGEEGDLWVDTDDANTLYRHNGTTFITVKDTDIADAALTAVWSTVTGTGKPDDDADVTKTEVEGATVITTGDAFGVGKDSNLHGSDAYINDSIYWNTYFDSIDAFDDAGAISLTNWGYLTLQTTTTSTDVTSLTRTLGYSTYKPSFTKVSKFKAWIGGFTSMSTRDVHIIVGNTTNGYGFKNNGSGNWHCYTVKAGTATYYDSSQSINGIKILEAVKSGASVAFYINGTLITTITTNVPVTGGFDIFNMLLSNNGTTQSGTNYLYIYQYKFLQDE